MVFMERRYMGCCQGDSWPGNILRLSSLHAVEGTKDLAGRLSPPHLTHNTIKMEDTEKLMTYKNYLSHYP